MTDELEDLSKLLLSAGLVFVGTVLGHSAQLLERVLVGRYLSTEAYGEFSIAIAILSLSATLSLAGYSQGIPRYSARFTDPVDQRGAMFTGILVTVPLAIGFATVLYVWGDAIAGLLFDSVASESLFFLFVVTVPLVVTFKLGIAAIRGQENTRYKILSQNVVYPGVRILSLVVFLSLGMGIHSTGYSYLIAATVTIFVTFGLLHRLIDITGPARLHIRKMTMFSAPLIVSTVAGMLLTRTDTIMLGYFRPSREVGIYNAAYPVAGMLLLILATFGYMYLPVASRLDGNGERDAMRNVYQLTTKWVFVLTFPVFVTFVVFPSEILAFIFGENYASGGIALAILSVGFFTNAAVGRNRETLSALGYTKFIMVSNAIAFGINVVTNLLLIPRYGFVGAAIASAGSFVTLNVVVYLFLALRFDIKPYNRRSIRMIVLLFVLVLPSGFALAPSFPDSPVGLLSFLLVTSSLTLFVAVFSRSFEPGDVVLVEFIEGLLGTQLPYVRLFIPDSE